MACNKPTDPFCIFVAFNEWNKYKEANENTYFGRTHNPSFVMQFLTNLYI